MRMAQAYAHKTFCVCLAGNETAILDHAGISGCPASKTAEVKQVIDPEKAPMPGRHEGGCLCGDVRYKVTAAPLRVTICHCTFCQRFTGSAFLVEPIFRTEDVAFSGTAPRTYDHRSDSSQKRVTLSFCARCGTTLCLAFERFPDVMGVCAGTFDDPNWFERGPATSRHIFTRSAQKDVVLPAGLQTYPEHAFQLDGTPNAPIVFAHARPVTREE